MTGESPSGCRIIDCRRDFVVRASDRDADFDTCLRQRELLLSMGSGKHAPIPISQPPRVYDTRPFCGYNAGVPGVKSRSGRTRVVGGRIEVTRERETICPQCCPKHSAGGQGAVPLPKRGKAEDGQDTLHACRCVPLGTGSRQVMGVRDGSALAGGPLPLLPSHALRGQVHPPPGFAVPKQV